MEQLVKNFEQLQTDRQNWHNLWDEAAFFCLPREGNITTLRPPGQELPQNLYTAVGRISSKVFAAGMVSYLSSPSQKWFALSFKDEGIQNTFAEILKSAEDKLYSAINRSNFYQQVYNVYRELATFGIACLYLGSDNNELIFHSRPVKEIYITENAKEEVEEVYRLFEFTYKQALDFFGDGAPQEVREKAVKEPFKKAEYIHYVAPRYKRQEGKNDIYNKPYQSLWIHKQSKKLCKEGGYDEFPFFIVRVGKNSGTLYGYSPAAEILPELRMANKMRETLIKKAQKQVDPPLDAPSEGYVLPLNISSGAINYHDRGLADNDLIRPLLPDVSRALPFTDQMIKDTEETIKRAFYVDLFLMLTELPKMTATEVMQRVSEKMMILAPMLGTVMHSLLDPLIHRALAILIRAGEIQFPPELQGVEYKIDYVSPLARAQKAYEMTAFNQFVGIVGEMAQMLPEVLDNIDVDKAVKDLAGMLGVNPSIIRQEGMVEQIRKQRQEAQQQAQQAQVISEIAGKVANGQA